MYACMLVCMYAWAFTQQTLYGEGIELNLIQLKQEDQIKSTDY